MSASPPAPGPLPADDSVGGTSSPEAVGASPRKGLRLFASPGVSGLLLYALVFALALTPVPYLLQTPGPVVNTLEPYEGVDLVSISGTQTYEAAGTLDMLTVAVSGGPGRDIFTVQAFFSLLNGVETVVPSEAYYPLDTTRDQVSDRNSADMMSSQDQATAAALGELDIDYDTVIGVSEIVRGAPAEGVLQPGDHVLAVDGTPVDGSDDGMQSVREAVVAADSEVQLTIERGGQTEDVAVEPAAPVESDGQKSIGVVMSPTYSFPFDVEFAVEGIGGPSAGTIFALTIIDMLTEGDLTGDQAIAGTGAIDASGTVSPIGGARQKVAAAAASGADYFLAPADNCTEVLGSRGVEDLTVVRIDDLSTAHEAVTDIAEGSIDSLPTCAGSGS
ncbi:YlbL family protein [Brevibacterium jeotgali]|uniref:PDZ domain-containing protein n=1 Tax=Brevibacterium jeotgali TaxID=1262550 RepID=A0A2H1L7S9_9MICO|nr:S16 family serine protease [Brevibacterium jeotgali]TWC03270.1 PDZ domain-containing protein [Brevibacterium jeotgali]SMY12929.1 PDZ domain-containing protein [Brevibacterium jeotgali]